MALSWLKRLAARAPVPVYPIVGAHAAARVQDLALDPRVRLVNSPRHARVLLIAGSISPSFTCSLRQIHEQVPAPKAVVWWRSTPPAELARRAILIERFQQIVPAVSDAYHSLLHGEPAGETELSADESPAPWDGFAATDPNTENMLASIPGGRPSSTTVSDAGNTLELDSLAFPVGPFWTGLPPGLCAQATLHGDVVDQFEVTDPPYPIGLPAVFFRALYQPVPIAELELARARYHLRQVSRALWLNGLEAQSLAVLQRVHAVKPGQSLSGLRNRLRRTGFFASAGASKGILNPESAQFLGGPSARAAGIAVDVRQLDRNYQRLSFKLTCNHGGNCHARWHQWFDEIEQALDLAGRARDKNMFTADVGLVETPRGPMQRNSAPDDGSARLEELLPGLEWSEAMATIASLDVAAVSDYGEDDS